MSNVGVPKNLSLEMHLFDTLHGLIKWMYVPFWFELKFSGNLVKRKIIHPLSKPTPHLVTFNFSSLQVKNKIVQKSFNKRHSFNTFYCRNLLISKNIFSEPPNYVKFLLSQTFLWPCPLWWRHLFIFWTNWASKNIKTTGAVR